MPRLEVDLLDGRFYAGDCFGAFAWMRENEPLYHDRNNDIWGVTLHEDIMTVSKAPDVFCSGQGFRPEAPNMPMMINMDRPGHMVRRNLVNRGFTPRRIAEGEPWVREIVTEILDDVIERGSCDFVRDIAARLPLMAIGDLLGVAREDLDDLLRWSDDTMSGPGHPDPEAMVRATQSFGEFREYILRVIAQRRKNPGGSDLMSLLVDAEVEGERLDDESILFESILILNGGDETTRHVISGGMYELLRNPKQWKLLAEDSSRLPVAIEEMLRWVSPIQNMMRTTTGPTQLRGVSLEAGERLLLLYPAANRDTAVFEYPEVFDVLRNPNPHVAFGGYGPHFCLGNALARLELRVMFEEVQRRLPDLRLATDAPLPRRPANFVTGFEEMPVRFTPGAREAR